MLLMLQCAYSLAILSEVSRDSLLFQQVVF
jgi:hypothetical protein